MIRALLLPLLLLGCSPAESPPQPASPCREQRFESSGFVVCDPGKGELILFGAAKSQTPIRRFADLPVDPASVMFAMNAGMFDEAGRPIGLAASDGVTAHPVNLRDGPGNFHLKPNGVFIVTANGKAMIVPSDRIPEFRAAPRLMTQSGPMLVIDGQLHPKIAPDGTSHYIRNGVGVTALGHPLFVISQDAVSLGRFARFFRDVLHTPDALYFDGSVSSLWDPDNGRMDDFTELGPIVVAVRRPAASVPGRAGRATP